ncbi:MAG: ABC transporter ATP-binding protein [Pseudomonadota bacterium]
MKLSLLLDYARPYRAMLVLAGFLMLLESLAALGIPWLGGRFAGDLLSTVALPQVGILSLLLVLFAVQAALRFATTALTGRTAEHIAADLRTRIHEHLQSLPLAFFQQHRRGDLLALLTHEVNQFSHFVSGTLLGVVPTLITLTGAIVLMFMLDPMLALLVTLMVPLFWLVLKLVGRRLRPLAIELQQTHADNVVMLDENLQLLPDIKAYATEALQAKRYRTQVVKLRDLAIRQTLIQAQLEPLLQFIGAAAVVLLLSLGGTRLSTQDMTPVTLITFLLYAALLTRPVGALAAVYGQVLMASATLTRMQTAFGEQPEARQGVALDDVRGDMEFRDVGFAYPGRAQLIDRLQLHIKAGETVAIVGANGCGKSTLIQLLLRLHLPDTGRILLDGHDTSTVALDSLRRQIGLVSQQVSLFNATVADNIGFARADATADDIEQAARMAQAHEFISQLPQGYATMIGDNGIRLSGGQRQRLALARALLKKAPILVLDEATAMFDPAGEHALLERFKSVLAHHTVILVTHRPASLALADRILLLRDGRLHSVPNGTMVDEQLADAAPPYNVDSQ